MPSRFYFDSATAPALSPAAVGAGWDHTGSQITRQLNDRKMSSAMATTLLAPDAADHVGVDADTLFGVFVSGPLATQTIAAQTVKLQIRSLEAHANNNLFTTWQILLINSSGIQKAVLLAIRRDGTETVTTTLTNKGDSATTTAVEAMEGDRLVVEIGLGGSPTASGGVQGHNGSMRFGDVAAADLAENDSATTDDNPWIEFANVIKIPHFFSENWDAPTPPALPASGYTTEGTVQTSTNFDVTAPNSLTMPDGGTVSTIYRSDEKDGNAGDVIVEAIIYADGATGAQENLVMGRVQSVVAWGTVTDYELSLRFPANAGDTDRGPQLGKRSAGTYTALVSRIVMAFGDVTRQIYYRLILICNGTTIAGKVQRLSDGKWVNSSGTWQDQETTFGSVTDSSITTQGYAGILTIQDGGSSPFYSDNFKMYAPPYSENDALDRPDGIRGENLFTQLLAT